MAQTTEIQDDDTTIGNCLVCGIELDLTLSGAKAMGCCDCDGIFCSADCVEQHEQTTGHTNS